MTNGANPLQTRNEIQKTAEVIRRYWDAKSTEHQIKIGANIPKNVEPFLVGATGYKNLGFYFALNRQKGVNEETDNKYVFILDLGWHYEPFSPLQKELGLAPEIQIGTRSNLHLVSLPPIDSHNGILGEYSRIMDLDQNRIFTTGGWVKSTPERTYLHGASGSFSKNLGYDNCHGIANFMLTYMFPNLEVKIEGSEQDIIDGAEFVESLDDIASQSQDPTHHMVKFLEMVTHRGLSAAVRRRAGRLQED
jgi:hypothetical protein